MTAVTESVIESVADAPAGVVTGFEESFDEVVDAESDDCDVESVLEVDSEKVAAGEDEWYSIVWVSPDSLIIGPNVREENATPDKENVRDIKKRGVRAPILAYRDEAGELVVTMGQIRTLSAVQAGRKKVPVWVQPPPTEDEKAAAIDRIIDQLGENDHRTGLTRGDTYRAHQQLRMFGLSATAIARRRSRSKRVIEDSLRVGDSELAAKAADKYDLTLDQAAVIAEFEGYGDLDAAKELILTAVEKPNNFAVLAQRKRDDRAEAERLQQSEAALVEQLTASGVTIFDESVSTWSGDARALDRLRPTPDSEPGTDLTPDAHADCPGHGAWIDYDYDDNDQRVTAPAYGCADFRAHGHALRYAPAGAIEHGTGSTARFDTTAANDNDSDGVSAGSSEAARAALEREKARIERRWVRHNNKDWDAAVKIRHKWLVGFVGRASAPKIARKWLAQQKLAGSHELRKAMERRHALAHRLLNRPVPGYDKVSDLVEDIARASEPKATVWDMYLTLAAMEEGLQRDSWRRPAPIDSLYMSTLQDLGYKLHDVELKVITPDKIDDVITAQLPHHPATSGDITSDEQDDEQHVDAIAGSDSPVIDLDKITDDAATGATDDLDANGSDADTTGDMIDDEVHELINAVEALDDADESADGPALDSIDSTIGSTIDGTVDIAA